ncbi:MAG: hypothetical protein Q8M31_22340 [Beijerinckiaceae bacterium]|nr:hypothetical protein [Beijerinckiaceae bacterium]
MANQNLPVIFKKFKAYEPHELQVLDMALAWLCDATATDEERRRAQRALLKLTQLTVPSVDALVALATDLLKRDEASTETSERSQGT